MTPSPKRKLCSPELILGMHQAWFELSMSRYFSITSKHTCVGVREMTKLRDILLQSPLPNFASPMRKSLCSSSVHGMPFLRSYIGIRQISNISQSFTTLQHLSRRMKVCNKIILSTICRQYQPEEAFHREGGCAQYWNSRLVIALHNNWHSTLRAWLAKHWVQAGVVVRHRCFCFLVSRMFK